MKPSSQGSRSARSRGCAASALETGAAAGSGFGAGAAMLTPNRQNNSAIALTHGRDILYPPEATQADAVIALKEILYTSNRLMFADEFSRIGNPLPMQK